MNYYTSTIPLDLAEKLQKKGMPLMTSVSISIVEDKPVVDENGEQWYRPSYAEVFDWLMNGGVHCTVTDTRAAPTYEIIGYISIVCLLKKRSTVSKVLRTWHEAANDAIEKALTLI